MISLRTAYVSEAKALTELAIRSKRAWGYDEDFMTAVMPDMIVHPEYLRDEHGIVAEASGNRLGYAIVRVDGHSAFLRDLFVDPDHFRRGVGRALFEEAGHWAYAQGAKTLRLGGDPNAKRFYERLGMIQVGEQQSIVGGARMLPIMEIDLANYAAGQAAAKVSAFWAAFVRANPSARKNVPETVSFGDSVESQSALARLVLSGRKRATTSLLRCYGAGRLPARDDLFIVVDGEGLPQCVCRTTSVEVKSFSTVDERFAFDEGEGDLTLENWVAIHRSFFVREAAREGFVFDDASAVVLERFQVIWRSTNFDE